MSDQDNDSMLSLREFCVALYLMERYREGQQLPETLPNSVMLDETLLTLAGPPAASYGSTAWGSASGIHRRSFGIDYLETDAQHSLRLKIFCNFLRCAWILVQMYKRCTKYNLQRITSDPF